MTCDISIRRLSVLLLMTVCWGCGQENIGEQVLRFDDYSHYFKEFNVSDNELYRQYVPNDSVTAFMRANIPLVDLPDSIIQKTYYFRWWTFRKHIKRTPNGFVVTEFLPEVPWSGKYNTINCPAAFHIYEGRWLRNGIYIRDYIDYWLTEADNVRKYSFWVGDAMLAFSKLHKDSVFVQDHLDRLIYNYGAWEQERRDSPDRLFWQDDNLDGMEFSAGGRVIDQGVDRWSTLATRPTINSYMYGDANAIANMASYLDHGATAKIFSKKAAQLKGLVEERLWNDSLHFFTLLPRNYTPKDPPAAIRELIGYTPWYFNLPSDQDKYAVAWEKLTDTTGFYAPYGLTTVERSHPYFTISYEGHECQWNGPSWPFATTQTLKSLSNFLNNYRKHGTLTKNLYPRLLNQYAAAHRIRWENGTSQMWIDENLNPFTGDWISRTRLKTWDDGNWSDQKGGRERGKDYNHSGFCDLVISDLIGFKPQWDGRLVVRPLVPESWDWFCLDGVNYQGRNLTILWDREGKRYHKGRGFQIILDSETLYHGPDLKQIEITL